MCAERPVWAFTTTPRRTPVSIDQPSASDVNVEGSFTRGAIAPFTVTRQTGRSGRTSSCCSGAAPESEISIRERDGSVATSRVEPALAVDVTASFGATSHP